MGDEDKRKQNLIGELDFLKRRIAELGEVDSGLKQMEDRMNAQLIQAQKMEALGTLAGGIAHDFNNILSAMTGYAELAMTDPDEKIRQNNLEQVLIACERAKKLVSQILAFSRKTSQEYKPIDMGTIVKEGLLLLKATLPSTIVIRRKIALAPGIVLGNPVQIQQVLMNLCINAAHAMGDNGGVLDVNLSSVEISQEESSRIPDLKAGSYVKLVVSDTGHGIDSLIVEHLLSPFFTTKTIDKGTGLGLTVVYGIIKAHGGAVEIQSEPGKGSTVHVYFPKMQVEEKPDVKDSKELPKGNESILYIDDETDDAGEPRVPGDVLHKQC
jgi:signal transduction histidine kinase